MEVQLKTALFSISELHWIYKNISKLDNLYTKLTVLLKSLNYVIKLYNQLTTKGSIIHFTSSLTVS